MSFYQQLCRDTVRQREALLAVPLLCNTLQGEITPAEYVAFLTQAYHHVRHTVPLLMACGSRMPERLAWLRQAIAHYIDEEIGHEQWILNDVAACGADPDAVQADGGSFETRLMVAYAYHGIDRGNPVGFLGMVHVLEGTSTAVASAAADAIQAALALPDAAFSYLRSHGSLDVEHVRFFETLLNRLHDPCDQAAVLGVARDVYQLYAGMFAAISRDTRIPAAA
jgi:pyrroloquinoline quinone (PQQ) biosynthesis protein C